MSAETPDPRPLEDIRADHAEAMQTLVTRHSHAAERLVADIPSLVAELSQLRRQHAAALSLCDHADVFSGSLAHTSLVRAALELP